MFLKYQLLIDNHDQFKKLLVRHAPSPKNEHVTKWLRHRRTIFSNVSVFPFANVTSRFVPIGVFRAAGTGSLTITFQTILVKIGK